MRDLDQLIEQIHLEHRQQLVRQGEGQGCGLSPRPIRRLWPYAAAVALVGLVGVALLVQRPGATSSTEVAKATMPRAEEAPAAYAYSVSTDGVRVYCEDNCNPDEVLARMKHVIKTLQ